MAAAPKSLSVLTDGKPQSDAVALTHLLNHYLTQQGETDVHESTGCYCFIWYRSLDVSGLLL